MSADGPVRASDLETATEKTADELKREATRKAVAAKRAQREGLRRAGADVKNSRGDLAGDIEDSLARRTRNQTKAFRARQAVEAMRERKRNGG